MIRSMTGYGRAQGIIDQMEIVIEIKSVNHRYFEFSCRVPRSFGFLEEKLKSFVSGKVQRGKVDLFLSINILESTGTTVLINHPVAEGYLKALEELATTYNIKNDVSAVTVAKYPDVLTVTKTGADEDAIWSAVSKIADEAITSFIEMRQVEGDKLKSDVIARGTSILDNVAVIEERSPETIKIYREKIEARMRELLGDVQIDEQRLLTETAVFADKITVAEETVRLRSHIDQLFSMMKSKDAIGRKLDFLVQEINREANTIGSKVQDVAIARIVVDIKSEIEKIREQIQNIE